MKISALFLSNNRMHQKPVRVCPPHPFKLNIFMTAMNGVPSVKTNDTRPSALCKHFTHLARSELVVFKRSCYFFKKCNLATKKNWLHLKNHCYAWVRSVCSAIETFGIQLLVNRIFFFKMQKSHRFAFRISEKHVFSHFKFFCIFF